LIVCRGEVSHVMNCGLAGDYRRDYWLACRVTLMAFQWIS
jgi:hypothetical protein